MSSLNIWRGCPHNAKIAAASLLLAACYHPDFTPGLQCSETGECPEGQSCGDTGQCFPADSECILKSTFRDELSPADPAASFFGYFGAQSGGLLALTTYDDASQLGIVSAYALSNNQWRPIQTVRPADPTPGGRFGFGMAMDGTLMVVGNSGDSSISPELGSAYVFSYDGTQWSQLRKLVPPMLFAPGPAPAAPRQFGRQIAVSGTTVAVLAVGSEEVYIYTEDGSPTLQSTILPVPGISGVRTGNIGAVAADDALVVVGAPEDATRGADAGALSLIGRTGASWGPPVQITAQDAAGGESLGHSVAIEGTLIAAGAPRASHTGGETAGAVYLFENGGSGWTQTAKLIADDANPGDLFGISVAVGNGFVAVGAPLDDDRGTNSGSVYLFVRTPTGWRQHSKLLPMQPVADGVFGHLVLASGSTITAMAPTIQTINGRVAVYDFGCQ